MSDVVIQIENLSKQYRLGLVGTGTVSHDLNRWWHRIRGKEDPYLKVTQVNDRTKAVKSNKLKAKSDGQKTRSKSHPLLHLSPFTFHYSLFPFNFSLTLHDRHAAT